MSVELLSLLKEQFGCCVKVLNMISGQEKIEAIQHIETVLADLNINFEESLSDRCKEEYFEDSPAGKEEDEDIKPDVLSCIQSDAGTLITFGKRKRLNSNDERKNGGLHEIEKRKSSPLPDVRDISMEEGSKSQRTDDLNSLNNDDKNASLNKGESGKNVLGCSNRFKCPLCTESCENMTEMTEHLRGSHSCVGKVKRLNTAQEVTKQDIRNSSSTPQLREQGSQLRNTGQCIIPVNTSPNYPLICPDCDVQFHEVNALVKHTRNRHQVYQCFTCGMETIGYYCFASHDKIHHQ